MRTRLLAAWDALRTSYWFVPALMTVGAGGLAAAALTTDVSHPDLAERLGFTVAYSPEGARAVLTAIAGAMVNVAALVFSITIVALTLASQQFGPRLLRNFLRDRGNQVVLGTFVATFLYCLIVLGAVHGNEEDGFVPHASFALGVALAIVSVFVLIYFIHHASTSIHASRIIELVGEELDTTIDRLFPERLGAPAEPPSWDLPEEDDGVAIVAGGGGYVAAIDGESLLELASEKDCVLRLDCRPGDPVVDGGRVATVWGVSGDEIADRVNAALILGQQRTAIQDLEFSIDQLVEVAVRALSPGVNDPNTAIECVDRLGRSLCRLAGRDMPSPVRKDAEGRVRVIARGWTFRGALDAACDQIRQNARPVPAVSIRLLEMLATVAERVGTEAAADAVWRQVGMIERGAREGVPDPLDRAELEERCEEVRCRLDAAGFAVRAHEHADRATG